MTRITGTNLKIRPNPGKPVTCSLMLTFSGGGTRAAAFSYGVLEALRDTRVSKGGRELRMLDEVDLISGVSGGSFTAAYYGFFGDRIFQDFEQKFLKKNVQGDLRNQILFNPANWTRLSRPFSIAAIWPPSITIKMSSRGRPSPTWPDARAP